jgi:hypothetical protein
MKLFQAIGITGVMVLASSFTSAFAEPMKELAVYKGNLGKFSCDAKEIGSGKTFKTTVEKTVLDGNTYMERYVEVKSADHPNPWNGVFLMSYDPATNRWVRNGVDNSGERNAASSAGWTGDTWVWESDGVNIVINKKGATGYTFAVDVKESGGGIKRVVEANCTRV